MIDTHITIGEIRAAEKEMGRIRDVLKAIGREIYKIRERSLLDSVYKFEGYTIQKYAGEHYHGQEGPDWGMNTPIVSLEYYWSRVSESKYVTFPVDWLDKDWRNLEIERLTAEEVAAVRAEKEAEADRAEATERSERESYERLKAKFEKDVS